MCVFNFYFQNNIVTNFLSEIYFFLLLCVHTFKMTQINMKARKASDVSCCFDSGCNVQVIIKKKLSYYYRANSQLSSEKFNGTEKKIE